MRRPLDDGTGEDTLTRDTLVMPVLAAMEAAVAAVCMGPHCSGPFVVRPSDVLMGMSSTMTVTVQHKAGRGRRGTPLAR